MSTISSGMSRDIGFVEYYAVMELRPNATQKDIEAAYARLSKRYSHHSGKVTSQKKLLDMAYKALSSPKLRAEYNVRHAKYQKLAGQRRREEDALLVVLKRQARRHAIRGFLWMLAGILVTGLTFLTAKPGSTYVVTWGAIMFGGYRFLANLYHYLYTYPLLQDAIGDKAAERFRVPGAGRRAVLKVGGVAGAIALTLLVSGALIIGGQNAQAVAAAQVPTAAASDDFTWQTADIIAGKINGYVANHKALPESLQDAGYYDAVPKAITYQKMTDTGYKVCVTYQTTGFSHTADGNTISSPLVSRTQLIESSQHTAGLNCQFITPVLGSTTPVASFYANNASDAAKAGCGIDGVVNGSIPQSGIITKTPTGVTEQGIAEYMLTIPSRGGGLIYKVPADAHVFDVNCKVLDHSVIYGGDTVDIFPDTRYPISVVGDPLTSLVVIDRSK